MSQALSTAHARGWNLATTLMVCITVFQAGYSEFGVLPSAEYDGRSCRHRPRIRPLPTLIGRRTRPAARRPGPDFRCRHRSSSAILCDAPWWWWKARPFDPLSRRPP
jgi:hypothetical protein